MFYAILAQTADLASQADMLPDWAKLMLGPLGLVVACLVWIIYTEKMRIPRLVEKLEGEQDEQDELRKHYESREEQLRAELTRCRDKYTKERAVRAWWQSKAEGFAKQLGTDSGIPPDINKTSMGSLGTGDGGPDF